MCVCVCVCVNVNKNQHILDHPFKMPQGYPPGVRTLVWWSHGWETGIHQVLLTMVTLNIFQYIFVSVILFVSIFEHIPRFLLQLTMGRATFYSHYSWCSSYWTTLIMCSPFTHLSAINHGMLVTRPVCEYSWILSTTQCVNIVEFHTTFH